MGDSSAQSPFVVTASEIDLFSVRVVMVINGLQITNGLFKKSKPKNASVDVEFGNRSLTMTAEVKGKNGQLTKYEHKVKKLPGEINKNTSSVEYKKDQVIINLKKAEETSWAVQLSQCGLEQADD